MRVLFYSSIFPRSWNVTLGIYCLHVCRALCDLGHDVRVVSPRGWMEPRKSARPASGVDGIPIEYPTYFYPPRVLQSEYDRFMALSSRRAMRRAMKELRPDAVLSYWAHPDGAVAARFARAAGIPSGVIVGGSDVLVLARHPGRRQRSVVRALHANDAIITVGRDLARAVEALGIPSRKVHVVYQGVDMDLFSPGPRSEARKRLGIETAGKVLVAVGSLLPVKGIDVLLDAMARLSRERRDVRLYLVGDGKSRVDLEAQARRLGLEAVVFFKGKVDQRQLPDWYRAADLTVLASRSEGVPNVLRESLACGTPFVATKVGGVAEIAEGTPCRLVLPEDVAALAEAIDRALAEPARDGNQVIPAGLLTWKASTQQIVDLFRSLNPHAVDAGERLSSRRTAASETTLAARRNAG
jgi:glycosyltransferase involved in cell wall biosynthesis